MHTSFLKPLSIVLTPDVPAMRAGNVAVNRMAGGTEPTSDELLLVQSKLILDANEGYTPEESLDVLRLLQGKVS
jgi:hypothetical protein